MSEISNKELVRKLTDYFKEQDIEVVAHALAHALIDISHILYEKELSEKDRIVLITRMHLNYASLCDFAKNGVRGKLKIHKVNSADL